MVECTFVGVGLASVVSNSLSMKMLSVVVFSRVTMDCAHQKSKRLVSSCGVQVIAGGGIRIAETEGFQCKGFVVCVGCCVGCIRRLGNPSGDNSGFTHDWFSKRGNGVRI